MIMNNKVILIFYET